MHLADASNGWAVGHDAEANKTLIIRTTDGAAWLRSNHPQHTGQLSAVFFVDANNGWAVGQNQVSDAPIILHTSDGGQTWEEQTHAVTTGNLRDLFFVNPDTGWAVGAAGSEALLLKTTDAGATWRALTPPQTTEAIAILFTSPLQGYMATNLISGGNESARQTRSKSAESTTLYETTDGGNSWTQILNTLAAAYTHALKIVEKSSVSAYIVGSRSGTGDSGPFIGHATVSPTSQLSSIELTPSSINMQVNDSQNFTATGKDPQDNTVTIPNPEWQVSGGGTLSPSGANADFTATQPGDYTITCREVGTTIADTADIHISNPTSVDSDPEVPTEFGLAQNYPNPFNPATTIEFSVKATSPVLLRITDLRGRLAATVTDAVHQPGVYKINFDARNLASGVYLYQIRMGDFQAVRKMVLLR